MLSILPRVGVRSPPGASHRAEGIIARLRGSAREKYTPWVPPHDGALPGGGIPPGGVQALGAPCEGRHHIAREPRQLLLELLGRHALGPVDHHVLEARIAALEVADLLDDVPGRAAEPGALRHAVADGGNARGRAGRAPGASLRVGVADEAEGREPLVA